MCKNFFKFLFTTVVISSIVAEEIFSNDLTRTRRDTPGCKIEDLDVNDICLTTSKSINGQLAMLSPSEGSAVILDPNYNQFGFLTKDGQGVFCDSPSHRVYKEENGNWTNKLSVVAPELQISKTIENLPPLVSYTKTVTLYLKQLFSQFGEDIKNSVQKYDDFFLGGLHYTFRTISTFSKSLISIVDYTTEGWLILKDGPLNLLAIFRWLNMFVYGIEGGHKALKSNGVMFSFKSILKATSRARAFWHLLSVVGDNMDFKLLKILTSPLSIAYFATITPMSGRKHISGIDGLFIVIKEIIQLTEFQASISVNIWNAVTRFLLADSFTSTDAEELYGVANDTLSIVERQDKLFKNRAQLEQFITFWKAIKADGEHEVNGLRLSAIINTLVDKKASILDTVTKIVILVRPKIPLRLTVPDFIASMLMMLGTPNGNGDLKKIMPDLDWNPEINEGKIDPQSNMSTTELIEKVPIAKAILVRLTVSIEKHANISNDYYASVLNSKSASTNLLRQQLFNFQLK